MRRLRRVASAVSRAGGLWIREMGDCNCYGAGSEGECCRTCQDIRAAYRRRGWKFDKTAIPIVSTASLPYLVPCFPLFFAVVTDAMAGPGAEEGPCGNSQSIASGEA